MKTLGNIKQKYVARLQRQRNGWDLPSTTLAKTSVYYPSDGILDGQKPNKVSWFHQSGAGFTLIELLIVAALFSLTALLATTIFSNVQSTQRATSGQQRVTSDGRYIMEKIAQSIRTETINYARENSNLVLTSPSADNRLSTINAVGQLTCYELNGGQTRVWTGNLTVCPDASDSGWTAFTPADIQVEALRFYITPVSDPNRPVPRITTDCKVDPPVSSPAAGLDSAKGACVCRNDADCFSGQQCISTATSGGACALNELNCICQNPNVQPQVTIFLKTKSTSAGPGEQAEMSLQTTVVSRVYQR